MSGYRGFTISFNAIGAGKILKKYLVLAVEEYLLPILNVANKNMIEAKCGCQIIVNTRALFRKGSMGKWIKYQLIQVIAPTYLKHQQAKKLLESILPNGIILEEYNDTARSRLQCNEFVPDNKALVFKEHRNGLTHYQFGEIDDLYTPGAPLIDKKTGKQILMPWKITSREKNGVSLPDHVFPLRRRLDIQNLLQMLLKGTMHQGDDNENNASNKNNRLRYRKFADDFQVRPRSPPAAFGLV